MANPSLVKAANSNSRLCGALQSFEARWYRLGSVLWKGYVRSVLYVAGGSKAFLALKPCVLFTAESCRVFPSAARPLRARSRLLPRDSFV